MWWVWQFDKCEYCPSHVLVMIIKAMVHLRCERILLEKKQNARFKQIIFSFGSFRKAENAPQEVTLGIWQAVFNLWKHGFRSPVYSFELNWVSGSVGGVTIFKSVTRRGAFNYPTFIMSSVMMMMQNLMICCRNLPWIYIFLWHIMSRKDTILISNKSILHSWNDKSKRRLPFFFHKS